MQQKQPSHFRSMTRVLVILAALLVFAGWSLNTPAGVMSKANAIGYAVCHRIDDRSFHVSERQSPLCARCTGMFLGSMLGIIYQAVAGRRRCGVPPRRVLLPLILMFLAFAVDGGNSYLSLIKELIPGSLENIPSLYSPNNTLRLFTGTGIGLGIAAALFPAFNQTVWADIDERPALTGLRSFGLLVALAIGLDLLLLTQNPLILYPLVLISSLSVVALLTMVYSVAWILLTRQENSFSKLTEMWLPLAAGLTIAMIQIAAIDWVRFWLTGTWGAFLFNLT